MALCLTKLSLVNISEDRILKPYKLIFEISLLIIDLWETPCEENFRLESGNKTNQIKKKQKKKNGAFRGNQLVNFS